MNMIPVKRKILTFFKRPHHVIRKYFRILILREILPLYSNENYDECWGFVSYKNKVVLDLGADYGSTAYYFLKRGAKKVIAVEGEEYLASKLLHNYGRDSRVKCIYKWIGSPNDLEKLIRLKPDMVKVDIEGAEIHIAKVSTELLLSVKEWVIEVHEKEVYEELLKLFLRLKFNVIPVDYELIGVYKIIYAINPELAIGIRPC